MKIEVECINKIKILLHLLIINVFGEIFLKKFERRRVKSGLFASQLQLVYTYKKAKIIPNIIKK